tara:strand:+ start:222 stop:812 length:591 start_codon:yes stop_codon:yes gene_type:complete
MAKSNQKKETQIKKKVTVKKKVDQVSEKPKTETVKVVKKATIKKSTDSITASKSQSQDNKVKKEPLKVAQDALYATGRRKESTAKVWIFKGSGAIKINHSEPLEYLGSSRLVDQLTFPLKALNIKGFDIRIDVSGGGLNGQAQASKLGISRALLNISEDYRQALREHGCLTQDRREKERKKYGKRGARKSPQFRKR